MYWNNRVVHMEGDGLPFFQVAEVFYEDDGSLIGFTPVHDLVGETLDDLQGQVWHIYRDVVVRDMPVLEESIFFGEESALP